MNESHVIITRVIIGNEVYDKVDKLRVFDRLSKLIDTLVRRIKDKLGKSDDVFFKYAYENADILYEIVQYHQKDEGGSFVNGIIYIGTKGFTSSDMGSDDDIMATIFHEFMHYIAFKCDIYPKRYDDIEAGIIYSENEFEVEVPDTEETFHQRAYDSFIQEKYIYDYKKYQDYPVYYVELNDRQKNEVQKHIIERSLKPEMYENCYRYTPSNHNMDEINAHEKTVAVQRVNVFTMSDAKSNFYTSEIERYTILYHKAMAFEKRKDYSAEGYEK